MQFKWAVSLIKPLLIITCKKAINLSFLQSGAYKYAAIKKLEAALHESFCHLSKNTCINLVAVNLLFFIGIHELKMEMRSEITFSTATLRLRYDCKFMNTVAITDGIRAFELHIRKWKQQKSLKASTPELKGSQTT